MNNFPDLQILLFSQWKKIPQIKIENHGTPPTKKKAPLPPKKKKKRSWPWSFLGLRGSSRKKETVDASAGLLHPPRASSRASSRASKASSRSSARGSHRPRRPSVRAAKIRRDVSEVLAAKTSTLKF